MKNFLRIIVYLICSICAYDIYCTVHLQDSIYKDEENPIAKVLIIQDEVRMYPNKTMKNSKQGYVSIIKTDVSKLVLFKVLGLVAALEIFDWLINNQNKKISTSIILTIFVLQIILFFYLTFH